MEEELKPCPFCGGQGKLTTNYSVIYQTYTCQVHCCACFVKAKSAKHHKQKKARKTATSNWNTRTKPEGEAA